jgi:hypothetical protein
MKNFILFKSIICLSLTLICKQSLAQSAQDVIYLRDGSQQSVILQNVSPERVKYKKLDDLEGPSNSYKKDNVLMVISSKGKYLVMSELDDSAVDANGLTDAFNNSLKEPAAMEDIIFLKNTARKISITKDSDPLVFTGASGKSEQLALNEVVAIIYFDGRHKIIGSIEEAAAAMAKFRKIPEESPTQPVIPGGDTFKGGETVPNSEAPVQKIGGSQEDIDMGNLGKITFEEYSDRAIMKVKRFTDYIKILASKSVTYDEANKAINGAVELFISENIRIKVSNINYPQVKQYKIREYLNRVKQLKYDQVDVEYSNVQYVGKLRKAGNGLYYGIVSFEQVFRGYKDGQLVYEDRTIKNQTIVIRVREDSRDGIKSLAWDVFLSDVGVIQTTKN